MNIIAIEGKDCAGKTTLVSLLQNRARTQGLPWIFLGEFSDSKIGDLIRRILTENRFFSLSENPRATIAETLLLAADLTYQMETIGNNRAIMVMDRGIVSLVCYQALRLRRFFPSLEAATKYVASLILLPSCQHHTILLTIPEEEMVRRIVGRGEKMPSPEELVFLREVERLMRVVGPEISASFAEIDATISPESLADRVMEHISQLRSEKWQ